VHLLQGGPRRLLPAACGHLGGRGPSHRAGRGGAPRAAVRARFAEARRRLGEAGLLRDLQDTGKVTDTGYGALNAAYFAQGIACPFLEEESCSIYEERPITCREYLVTSPAENCSRPTPENIRRAKMLIPVFNAVARWQVPSLEHFLERWVPLILAPEWAEDHPDDSPPRPGLDLLRGLPGHLTGGGVVYQSMLELMRLLRAHGFKIYIVTGGGQDFVRALAEPIYGVPPEQVIGSAGKARYEYGPDGKPVLIKLPSVLLVDNGGGKPEGINLVLGRRPHAGFGNSDGDRLMLEWTQAGPGRRLMMLVHHDDAGREYAYGVASAVGTWGSPRG
jgi:hypothetical protein